MVREPPDPWYFEGRDESWPYVHYFENEEYHISLVVHQHTATDGRWLVAIVTDDYSVWNLSLTDVGFDTKEEAMREAYDYMRMNRGGYLDGLRDPRPRDDVSADGAFDFGGGL